MYLLVAYILTLPSSSLASRRFKLKFSVQKFEVRFKIYPS